MRHLRRAALGYLLSCSVLAAIRVAGWLPDGKRRPRPRWLPPWPWPVRLHVRRRTGYGGSRLTLHVGRRGWSWLAAWLPPKA